MTRYGWLDRCITFLGACIFLWFDRLSRGGNISRMSWSRLGLALFCVFAGVFVVLRFWWVSVSSSVFVSVSFSVLFLELGLDLSQVVVSSFSV